MTIKAVVFDLDGTIVTFNLDYKSLRAEVRGYLVRIGVPPSVLKLNENIFDMLKKTELFMTNSGKSKAFHEIKEHAMNIADRYELEASAHTGLLPGAFETLKDLKKMGLKIGLCTVSSTNSTENILNRFKLAEYFDAVITREKVSQVKPSPEHCQAALDSMRVSAAETLVIGDSVNDMIGARELKAIAVGLPTGVASQAQLASEGANYIVTSIIDLPLLVEKINKTKNGQTSSTS